MKRLNKALCAGMLCAIAGMSTMATTAQAEGFALFEWSARANALGGAVVARADDPSAIAFNPAGITQLEGAQVQMGISTITPSIDIKTNSGTYSNNSDTFYVPNGYYSQQLNDKWWLGIGMYSRFGLGIGYDSDWAGATNIIEANLETFSITPVLAYKVNDQLSVSVGFEVMKAYLDLTKNLGAGGTELYADADSTGLGALAAIHYKPTDDWAIGLSYKSEVKQEFKGDAELTGAAASSVAGNVVLPDELLFGVAYQATDKLSIEVGAVWTHWSNYKQLRLYLDDAAQKAEKKHWKNTMRYNVGVEYEALDWLDLRFAYTYDESPVTNGYADYMVPTNDRHLLSTGAGFRIDDWTIDISYTCILASDRSFKNSSNAEATGGITSEGGITHVAGLSVGYKF